MFGWRKRIGYIGPTVMEVVPYEFYRFAPDGIGLVGVTCNIDDWSAEYFDQALAQVTTAAAYLGSRAVDFIIHGGGPLVVARGKGYRRGSRQGYRESLRRARAHGRARRHGMRCATSARSASRSPRPIRSGTIDAMTEYLGAHGFDIVRAEGMDVPFKRAAERFAGRRSEASLTVCSHARRPATRSICPARNGRRRRLSMRWNARPAFLPSPIPTQAFSSHSRRWASRIRSKARAGCWPRCRGPRYEALARGSQIRGRRCLALRSAFPVWLTASRLPTFTAARPLSLRSAPRPRGGYDVAARTIANHMSRHIPGNPAIVVRNMPGAAGLDR